MESQPKSVACPFYQQIVPFPSFHNTLRCSCGAKYHYEFIGDLAEEISNAEEDAKVWKYILEWKYIFVGVAEWYEETKCTFDINYDAKEEELELHDNNKIYLFFVNKR